MEEDAELIEPGPALLGPTSASEEAETRVEVETPACEQPTEDVSPDVEDDGDRAHVVESGDTLTGLASRYLGSITRFGEIYDLNRDRLSGPNDLRLGMRLRIPPSNPADAPPENSATALAPEPTDAGTKEVGEAPEDGAGKLFIPARKTPFVPSRYRTPGVPSAQAAGAIGQKRE